MNRTTCSPWLTCLCVAAPAFKTWNCSARTRLPRCPGRAPYSRSDHRWRFLPTLFAKASIETFSGHHQRHAPAVCGPANRQPSSSKPIIDMDGFLVETTGQCKQGMDIAYDGTWGYHALVLTLANTGEVLSVVNRSGNRPSQEGAAEQVDRAMRVCFDGGFRRVLLRGDSKFTQTAHLDRWDDDPRVRFIFGFEAAQNLKGIAEDLPEPCLAAVAASGPLCGQDPARVRVRTTSKKPVVVAREFENQRLQSRGGRRIQLSADGLHEDVSHGGRQEEHLGGERRASFCSIRSCTSSTSPMTGSARPTRSSSRPTIVATRRTCWRNCTAACGRCTLRSTTWRAIGLTW